MVLFLVPGRGSVPGIRGHGGLTRLPAGSRFRLRIGGLALRCVAGSVARSAADLEEARETRIAVEHSGRKEGHNGNHGSGAKVPDNPQGRGGPAVPPPAVPELGTFH
jgi:hypothetical protein